MKAMNYYIWTTGYSYLSVKDRAGYHSSSCYS